jgi:hypothetical protein
MSDPPPRGRDRRSEPPPSSAPPSSAPPSPFLQRPARPRPTTTGRRLGPNRRHSRLGHLTRLNLQVRRDALHADLATLDRELASMTAARIAMLDELDTLRERLWPIEPRQKGRRPPAHDQLPLAAIAADARPLWGHALRRFAVGLLDRHGATSLRDLHDLIHRYGYCIDSATPVKALGDALGYEADAGRARRVRRGVYESVARGPGRRPSAATAGAGHATSPFAGRTMTDAQAEAILADFRRVQEERERRTAAARTAPGSGPADEGSSARRAPSGEPEASSAAPIDPDIVGEPPNVEPPHVEPPDADRSDSEPP